MPFAATMNKCLTRHPGAIWPRPVRFVCKPSTILIQFKLSLSFVPFQVIIFAEQLFQAKVALSEIGIITPYQLQAKKIRDHFEVIFGADVAPKVGSVEEFQGQERMVVLISTVRSTSVEAQNDVKCNAGFVKSARRLNVAVSRARAVVVVFGNPDLLEEDEYWKNLIYECKENGTFVGSERRLFQY